MPPFGLFLKTLKLYQDLPPGSRWQTKSLIHPTLCECSYLCVLSTKQKIIGLSLILYQGGDKAVWLKGGFFCIFDCFFTIRKLSCSRTSVLSSHKRYGKDFTLLNLNDDKVIHLILKILYMNTAKSEHIVPLKLLQWFHQTIFSRRCFQRTSHRNTIWQIWPGTMSFLKSMIPSYWRLARVEVFPSFHEIISDWG